jgi:hypothetical protein
MSGTFSIAAVTATLKDLLNNGLADHDLSAVGNVVVTALPPDRIPVTNADEKSQLNLFMFQVVPNASLRNAHLPSRNGAGERMTNPPLAIDLHYLITAYGEKEFHAEVLLGYAMQLLHENPILTREMINATLKPSLPPEVTLPPGLALLSTSGLAEQAETIKITPYLLNPEEMSRLWSAMQAKYRPTAAYQVSVILIESDKTGKSALPVLKRGEADRGPAAQPDTVPRYPTITALTFPKNQTAALPGDVVTVSGLFLAGETGNPADVTVAVQLIHPRLPAPVIIVIPPANRTDKQVVFTAPNAPASFYAGVYTLSLAVTPAGKPDEARTSAEIPFVVAPRITSALLPLARVAVDPLTQLGTANIALTCAPEILPEQRVSLVLGSRETPAAARAVQTAALTFVFMNTAAGDHWLRLRVDGAESLLIDRSDPKDLKFDGSQKLTLT